MFEILAVNSNYEICRDFPHVIRKRRNQKVIKESNRHHGYLAVHLVDNNGKATCHYKHRLIAIQFIPNPDNLPCIDHKNQNTSDYRVDNLRWVTSSQNLMNKSISKQGEVYEYVDTIPNKHVGIHSHNGHIFKNYYFDTEGVFYHFNGLRYRVLPQRAIPGDNLAVALRDIKNNSVSITLRKFFRVHTFRG